MRFLLARDRGGVVPSVVKPLLTTPMVARGDVLAPPSPETSSESNSEIEALLPLTESTLYILMALAPGPTHGYAILKDVATLSEERVRLGTGTLYGALKRLLDSEWIARAEDPEPNLTDRPRKCYELTDRGRALVRAELNRLSRLVNLDRARRIMESLS